jgi:hypothetical protein
MGKIADVGVPCIRALHPSHDRVSRLRHAFAGDRSFPHRWSYAALALRRCIKREVRAARAFHPIVACAIATARPVVLKCSAYRAPSWGSTLDLGRRRDPLQAPQCLVDRHPPKSRYRRMDVPEPKCNRDKPTSRSQLLRMVVAVDDVVTRWVSSPPRNQVERD